MSCDCEHVTSVRHQPILKSGRKCNKDDVIIFVEGDDDDIFQLRTNHFKFFSFPLEKYKYSCTKKTETRNRQWEQSIDEGE